MTSTSESLRLADLLCSRLCHDLSGIMAALIGMLEIAREEQPESETVAVATETAFELGERLKLLRAAWGQASEELDLARLQSHGASLTSSRRLHLDLTGLEPGAVFQPAAGRVILNLLLLAGEALPGGGIIALSGSPASNILITISGPRAAWPAGLGAFLADDGAASEVVATSPRNMQAPLTALLAREHGFRLSMLMPASAGAERGALPPLLLSFAPR